MWPRFKLTPQEEKNGAVKYTDQVKGVRGVARRFYTGSLSLTETERQPSFTFAISRRCRVFGLTASGDINQFKVTLADTSGENYFATPVSLAALLGGYVELPPAALGAVNTGPTGGFPYPQPIAVGSEVIYGNYHGQAVGAQPLIFEPNIVLRSNQAITLGGQSQQAYDGFDYRIDACLHVWEFPAWNDGPT